MYPYENLIVITDRQLCRGDFLTQLRRVVSLQPSALLLREKDLSDEEYLHLAGQVRLLCDQHSVPFFVHGRICERQLS